MMPEEINERMNALSLEIPWAHLFEFSPDAFSVAKENEKFLNMKVIKPHSFGLRNASYRPIFVAKKRQNRLSL